MREISQETEETEKTGDREFPREFPMGSVSASVLRYVVRQRDARWTPAERGGRCDKSAVRTYGTLNPRFLLYFSPPISSLRPIIVHQ